MRLILTILLFAAPAFPQAQILTAIGSCNEGDIGKWSVAAMRFVCQPSALASGSILMIDSGTCPANFSEVAALNGKTLIGTLAANGDVGTTGGANNITPTVNSLTAAAQTVNSLTAAAQTFTGASTTVPALAFGTLGFSGNSSTVVVNHVHIQTINSATTGSTGAGFPALLDASTSGGPTSLWMSTANPTGGAASYTPAGSITGSTATGALTPLGSNGTSVVTGTMNTSAVTGTLNAFDNRSAFTKVIFCKRD